MSEPVLEINNLSKRYGSDEALDEFSLNLQEDEILTLIGPSGCGKTTALRVVAGLEKPDSGTVSLRGRQITGPGSFREPEERDIGFIFQDLALFSHMTVEGNVAFGLEGSSDDSGNRVDEVLSMVGLEEYRDRYPGELSGGQRQRVALARSLVVRPSVILMDEPLSNIDKELRDQLRRDVKEILTEAGIPTIFVTHDQGEAIFLGDRTAVMNGGTIEQVGDPQDVVVRPESRFVAEFLGPTEFLPAKRTEEGIETEVDLLPDDMVNCPTENGDSFDLMVRADDVRIEEASNGHSDGVIENSEFLGGLFRHKIRLKSGHCIFSLVNHSKQFAVDTPVDVELDPGHQLVGFERTEEVSRGED